VDGDGDGFGVAAQTTLACKAPPGYATNSTDCDDTNANVKPGQTAFFTVARSDGSFDYDCDGAQTVEYSSLTKGSCMCIWGPWGGGCGGDHGWKMSTVPACGESGDFIANGCAPDTVTQMTQGCR
jgi:hypothetical protein